MSKIDDTKYIDFSDCKVTQQTYGGVNGDKIGIIYNNERYLLKFPSIAKLNDNMHYTNGNISEYIGCHIFNDLGIKAQETLLGTYTTGKGIVKNVVACKDFTDLSHGIVLQDFASLKNNVIDSVRHGYGTDLDDILDTIDQQRHINADELREHFWNTFVIDEFIANPDRHNGNWGFLYNSTRDENIIAPIYDCGSSLLPQADQTAMETMLKHKPQLNIRIYERPTSAITVNGKRINYNAFNEYGLNKYPEYRRAMLRIEERLSPTRIAAIIDNTPNLSELQNIFYKTLLSERKEILLDQSLLKTMVNVSEIGAYNTDRIPGAISYTHNKKEQVKQTSLKQSYELSSLDDEIESALAEQDHHHSEPEQNKDVFDRDEDEIR